MKTHNFRFNPNLLAVELPKLVELGFRYSDLYETIGNDYEYVAPVTEITEEMAEQLVEKSKFYNIFYESKDYKYKNYKGDFSFKTAIKSLMSGIESEIYWENPIPEPEIQGGYDEIGNFIGGWDDKWVEEYQAAQFRTFDKNRTIIFKKVK